MRFERRLLSQRRSEEEWKNEYIDYGALKRSVYAAAGGQQVEFAQLLHAEADKASTFFQRKCDELLEQLSRLELLAKDEGGSQSAKKQLVSDVSPEVRALRSFALLNYTAVIKAAKKWNKNVPGQPVDAHEILKQQPFFSGPQLPRLVSRAEVLAGRLAPSGSRAATDFQCPICFGVLHNPVVLACTHRFCFNCIAKQGTSKRSECPVCRKPLEIETGELEIDPTLDDFIRTTFPPQNETATAGAAGRSNSYRRAARRASSAKRKAMLVGIDGARPDALLASRCPTFASLIEGGGAFGITFASPGTSREDCAYDQTLVWRSILTGCRAEGLASTTSSRTEPASSAFSSLDASVSNNSVVDQPSTADNDDVNSTYPHDESESSASSIFDMLQSEIPSLRCTLLASSGGVSAEHSMYSEHMPNDDTAASEACKRLDRDLVVVQLDAARRAGLSSGFGPQYAAYREALESVDDHCARLMRALYSRMVRLQILEAVICGMPHLVSACILFCRHLWWWEMQENHRNEDWLLIITTANPIRSPAKHRSCAEDCALVLTGPSIRPGTETTHKPSNLDICPTVLQHFGVEPLASWCLEGESFDALRSAESRLGQEPLGCQPDMLCLSLPPMPPTIFANLPGISDVGSFAIIGHRGAGADSSKPMVSGLKRPKENTVESFTIAHSLGASWVETDVQFTRDGVPVIEHDFDVEVSDEKIAELREFTLHELKNASKYEVLQLQDALEASPDGLAFNLELKYRADSPPSAAALEGEMSQLLQVAERHIERRRIAYSSFAQEPLAILSRMQRIWPLFALASRAGGGVESVENALDSAKRNGLSGIVGDVDMLQAEPSLVSIIRAEGLLLISYGQRNADPSILPQQVRWGICGIITDDVPAVEQASYHFSPMN